MPPISSCHAESNEPVAAGAQSARLVSWFVVLLIGPTISLLAFWGVENLSGQDGYFHLAIASDYVDRPFHYEVRVSEGALAAYPSDKEPLFHLQLAALLSIGVEHIVAACLTCSMAILCLSIVLHVHLGQAWIVVLVLLCSATWLARLWQPRPHIWAVVLVTVGILALRNRRWAMAGIIAFVYTLSYSVPAILPVAALVQALTMRLWRGAACVSIGVVAALLLHPHFPNNLWLLWYQGPVAMYDAIFSDGEAVERPNELQPQEFLVFLRELWVPLGVLIIGIFQRSNPLWLVIVQLGLALMTWRCTRFVEYFVPVAFLGCVPGLYKWLPSHRLARWALVTVVILISLPNGYSAITHIRDQDDPPYREVAAWLKLNAAGENVLNIKWDAYPELRYFGGNFQLVQGHGPLFLAAYDGPKYNAILALATGHLAPDGIESLGRALRCRLIVAPRPTPLFKLATSIASNLRIRFEDEHVYVFEIAK